MSVAVSTTVAIVLSVVVALLIVALVGALVCVWKRGSGPMPLHPTPMPLSVSSGARCENV